VERAYVGSTGPPPVGLSGVQLDIIKSIAMSRSTLYMHFKIV